MNTSGDAAEQVVRLSLEGVEVAAKISGSAAKNIAAMIYTILKNRDKNQLKGRQRLEGMLKSGKELTVFSIKSSDLKQFAQESKRYGFVYCALKGKGKDLDGMVDVMVRAEDASKVNRVAERFKMATVDVATIKSEIEKSKETKSEAETEKPVSEKTTPEKNNDDQLLDELLGAPVKKDKSEPENPEAAKAEKSHPSEPTLEKPNKTAKGTDKENRPSVREEIKAIRGKNKKEAEVAKREDKATPSKEKSKAAQHKQPKVTKKRTKKAKER
ncbi:hypothetical protein M2150_001801 [Lachnospiraceae bacterium PM6-15]|uniref:PcfB family protein n=1 Tax=Ohessyouella blattaphilus TaxID=2949333 RepID=UPI003E1825AB